MEKQADNLVFLPPNVKIPSKKRTVAIIHAIHALNEGIKNAIEFEMDPSKQLEKISQASNDITELTIMLRDTCKDNCDC